ncbi:MAG: A/G-specific adenine glycosylase [Spirochaetaceae bacterium]|jgi:A/G-specific adenine glycosylase|nr:A/G-specific adenine glycosylase [Spirochaetaceae bacterium]
MYSEIDKFRKIVCAHYEKNGRKDLPWRINTDPWAVLISEFMLQQTQIERVIPYWERWMKLWPSPEALSEASLQNALLEWNGLGYNRRGRFLWESARKITREYGGMVPSAPEELITLPGIGHYSAGAIACFAYNYPAVFIETNIRAALIHFFFADHSNTADLPLGAITKARHQIKDSELFLILEEALQKFQGIKENPRIWYWALMDWGAALKKTEGNPSRQSAHYTRQSRFEGSFRQRRGALLRALVTGGPANAESLQKDSGSSPDEFYPVIEALEKDLMVCCKEGMYMIRE